MKDDHEVGKCYACHTEKWVRHKNLYTMGSEGTMLCMPCEREVLEFLRAKRREAIKKRNENED